MEVSTIQMAQWRKAEPLGFEIIDTTVRSGIKAFAPTWDMVTKHKTRVMSDEEYTKLFNDMMGKSMVLNAVVWRETMKKPKITLACYCSPDKFCHRHLLVKLFESYCNAHDIPFRYLGEIG